MASNRITWPKGDIEEYLRTTEESRDGEVEEILKLNGESEILKGIINLNKIRLLKHLTENEQNFIANVNLELWIELINLSAEKEFLEVYQELKKFERNYERKTQEGGSSTSNVELNYEYKNVLDDISKLHADISEGKFNEVKSFNEKYPKLKLCFDSQKVSALERSIDARQFHIYAFLRAKGFYSDKGQELKVKIEELEDEEKEKIRVEILNFTNPDPIGLILTKCKLDASNDVIKFHDIRQMLDDLIKVEEIRPVLEILAQSEVKIIFDYNEESVVGMDPTGSWDELVLGLAYFREGILYVGRNQSRAQRFGTFAHEATHFALYLLYENSCLPYREEDAEKERVWVGIVGRIRRMYERNEEGTDNVIKWVYEFYSAGYQQEAELIVRVNDLLAFYSENPQKCEEVRETYKELFDFYKNFVLPDLKMKNAYKIIKLNNDFELFEEIKNSNFQVKSSEKFLLLECKENLQKVLEDLRSKNSNKAEVHSYSELLQHFDYQHFLLLSDVPQMTLSKFLNEIFQKSSNKLEAKVKNLFINFERLQQENLRKEFEEILKSSQEILRLVIHLKVDESQSEEKMEESLKLLKVLTKFSGQIFLVASFESEKILKIMQTFFKIENSKVEIKGESLKFMEASKSSETSQSSLKFLKVGVKNFWNDLTEKSREEILKFEIKFRGESFPISSLFEGNLSQQTLNFLSSGKKFEVQPKKAEEIKFYFKRKFLNFKGTEDKIFEAESEEKDENEISNNDSKSEISENEKCFSNTSSESDRSSYDDSDSERNFWFSTYFLSLDEFIYQNLSSKVVLISEIAGSGKTTLLHKIHQTLNEKFQNFWVCFVSLLKHKKILLDRDEISANFLDFLCDKILNLSEIERKVFELKYERNEVVILFDGFDEISPDCKRNAIKIFKLHKESEKSQIWITTRTHLEKDLRKELKVRAHKIKPLNEEEQIEFLCKFWEESCIDSVLRQKCAEKLVKKIEEMRKWGEESLIGLTLQLRLLGELFKEELCEDFDEKIKNLSLSQVYEFLIERSVKFKEQNSVHDILKLHSDIYQVLALKRWTKDSEKFKSVNDHLFGFENYIETLSDEKLEELTRGGIISYDENGEISFLHRTVEEFFVWLFAFNRIKNFKKNWKFEKEFCEFFDELLSSYITRLDECFKELWKSFDQKSQKNYEGAKNFAQSFHKFLVERNKKEKDKFLFNASNFLSYSTLFALKAIKIASIETFQKIIESIDKTYSMFYLARSFKEDREPKIYEEVLEEVFKTFNEDSKLFDFLMRKDKDGNTVFHQIVHWRHFNLEPFKKFWTIVEERNFELEKVLKIFFEKGTWGMNFFTYALLILDEETHTERIDAVIEVVKRNLKVEDQRKLLREVQFGWCNNEKNFLRVFEFLKEIFNAHDIYEVLTSDDETYEPFLHHAADDADLFPLAVTKIFSDKIFEVKEEKIVREFLLKRDREGRNILMRSVSSHHSENFFYLFDQIFLKFSTFEEFAYEVDDKGWNILHFLAGEGNFTRFEHFMKKAQSELSEKKFKKFCQQKTKKLENIFHLIAQNRYNCDVLKLYVEFLSKIFTRDEMRNFLSEIDNEGLLPQLEIYRRQAAYGLKML